MADANPVAGQGALVPEEAQSPPPPDRQSASGWRRLLSDNVPRPGIAVFKLVLIGLVLFAVSRCGLFDGPTSVIMHVTAETRSASYTVSSPAFATLGFPGEVFLRQSGDTQARCVEGTASLAVGTQVRYSIGRGDLLIVTLEPSASGGPLGHFDFDSGGDGRVALHEGAALVYGAMSDCGHGGDVLLPIWGQTVIGETPSLASGGPSRGVPGPVLLEGRIDVFGVSRFRGDEHSPDIYPANTVPLPAGAMVRTNRSLHSDGTVDVLRGFALYSPDQARSRGLNALSVSLSGDVNRLEVFRWGSGVHGEQIAIQPLAEVFGDPNRSRANAAFLVTITLLGALYGLWHFLLPRPVLTTRLTGPQRGAREVVDE